MLVTKGGRTTHNTQNDSALDMAPIQLAGLKRGRLDSYRRAHLDSWRIQACRDRRQARRITHR